MGDSLLLLQCVLDCVLGRFDYRKESFYHQLIS